MERWQRWSFGGFGSGSLGDGERGHRKRNAAVGAFHNEREGEGGGAGLGGTWDQGSKVAFMCITNTMAREWRRQQRASLCGQGDEPWTVSGLDHTMQRNGQLSCPCLNSTEW